EQLEQKRNQGDVRLRSDSFAKRFDPYVSHLPSRELNAILDRLELLAIELLLKNQTLPQRLRPTWVDGHYPASLRGERPASYESSPEPVRSGLGLAMGKPPAESESGSGSGSGTTEAGSAESPAVTKPSWALGLESG